MSSPSQNQLISATESAQLLFSKVFPEKSHKQEDSNHIQVCIQACEMAIEAQSLPQNGIVRSIDVAQILAQLNLDDDTMIAALISDANLDPVYPLELIRQRFGKTVANLVEGIRKLNQFREFQIVENNQIQHERLRQMLLAMTSDIRIMVLKLGYRVARLRNLKYEDELIQREVAHETQLIFAPLANRLGIAQLKWELEDLSFRFLNPVEYKSIAKGLQSKRTERETYIEKMLSELESLLATENIHAKITGRPKHIYSIWKKMSKKNVPIEELYDLRAVRIYVDSIRLCYEVLGLIHSKWNYIKQEFDDYIATPKDNGYQSIHTVIIGPEGHTVEIQIRTFDMHHNAEYGVAAHWRYKEGENGVDKNLERSIASVRQMLENADNPDVFQEISTELQSQHIYVMTPNNEIITLQQGSTPLDFAYNIHTELGHRCRGAKINGRIRPLNTPLETGDKIEVLTINQGHPSRNWLNPNLGYLKSNSARQKVRTWFNKQNRYENIQAGESLFHKEIKRLHAENIKINDIVERFYHTDHESFFEDLGKGRINERQLAHAIQAVLHPKKKIGHVHQPVMASTSEEIEHAYVVGATNIHTSLAPCCDPTLGDAIVGYVTRGRGVTVHKSDCKNILNLNDEERRRLIDVTWERQIAENRCYEAELHVLAFDRKGLLRDVMATLSEMNINLIESETQTDKEERTVTMKLTLEVGTALSLSHLLDKIEMIQNIESVSIKTLQ